jgi:5'-3' exonuclease
MARKKVLIDGDVIAYRSAFSAKDKSLREALDKTHEIMGEILSDTLDFPTKDRYSVYLTGSGNFRYDISEIYKANRPKGEKPKHLVEIRELLINEYGAVVSSDEEADDLIGIAATQLGPEAAIVASVDKDMLQIPATHYNIRRKDFQTVTEEEGIKFFYTQILTGDTIDNIIGLYGIGPIIAKRILYPCKTELELWETVVKHYDGNADAVLANARLLWLRRVEGQIWQPPTVRSTLELV